MIVPYAFALCYESILFVSNTAVHRVRQTGNLNQFLDVVERVKDRMIHRNVFDLDIRIDLLQILHEVVPLETAPEIIDHPKAAAIEVLAHDLGVLLRKYQLAGLTRI